MKFLWIRDGGDIEDGVLLVQPGAESAQKSFTVQGGGEEVSTLTLGHPC